MDTLLRFDLGSDSPQGNPSFRDAGWSSHKMQGMQDTTLRQRSVHRSSCTFARIECPRCSKSMATCHEFNSELSSRKRGLLLAMILCTHCYSATEVAYNELCYRCYRKIGRLPRNKIRKEVLVRAKWRACKIIWFLALWNCVTILSYFRIVIPWRRNSLVHDQALRILWFSCNHNNRRRKFVPSSRD